MRNPLILITPRIFIARHADTELGLSQLFPASGAPCCFALARQINFNCGLADVINCKQKKAKAKKKFI